MHETGFIAPPVAPLTGRRTGMRVPIRQRVTETRRAPRYHGHRQSVKILVNSSTVGCATAPAELLAGASATGPVPQSPSIVRQRDAGDAGMPVRVEEQK